MILAVTYVVLILVVAAHLCGIFASRSGNSARHIRLRRFSIAGLVASPCLACLPFAILAMFRFNWFIIPLMWICWIMMFTMLGLTGLEYLRLRCSRRVGRA